MTADVVTAAQEASIQEALKLMRKHSIRHLPVVNDERELLGWVSDADLRGLLIPSMLEELTLADVMIKDPHTAPPDMALEDAARLILEKRIGGLPIVEGRKLLGIITVVDILAAFITMLGVLTHSSRLDVTIPARGHALETITRILRTANAEILSICHIPATGGKDRTYSFRLKKCDIEALKAKLKEKGFEVVSALA
jgi:acetoin utilization protein AcuB